MPLSRLETTLVEAQVVMLLASIGTLGIRDAAADIVGISKLIKRLVVRSLEIIVYHTALLLLSKSEIMAFQLGLKNAILLLLCL